MKIQHLTSVWFFCTPGRIELSPVQLINTDKKAAGVTAPSRKGLCMHGYNTLRKGVVMDFLIQTTILRLLKGWEVEFLLKTTKPKPHEWLYKIGKIVHPMFLGFPSLWETVERRSQQWSTGRACRVACWVPPAVHLSLICLSVLTLGQELWLGQSIATPFSSQCVLSKVSHFIIDRKHDHKRSL